MTEVTDEDLAKFLKAGLLDVFPPPYHGDVLRHRVERLARTRGFIDETPDYDFTAGYMFVTKAGEQWLKEYEMHPVRRFLVREWRFAVTLAVSLAIAAATAFTAYRTS